MNDESKNEKQAMRFAIQIKNANLADDCGIVLTAPNGKAITVSVKEGYDKIYEIDETTVTYVAAVTGIPTKYAAEDFKFSGFTTPIDSTDSVDTSSISRNLTQVANAAGYDINTDNDKITATEMGGDLVKASSWNKGNISLDKNLGGKMVKISFKVRVEGEIADGVVMNFQTNYGETNPNKWNNSIGNTWTSFSFDWQMPERTNENPVLYFSASNGSTYDEKTMKFYIKGFSASIVDENALEGTAINPFSYGNGANETIKTVTDKSLDKEVTQLTTSSQGYQNTGIIVKFTLPEGKTLSDYNTISMKIKSDQQGWKNMGIDWRESQYKQTSFGNSTYGAYTICEKTDNHYQSSDGVWMTETFSLDYTASGTDITTKQSGQDVYLGILYDAGANTNVSFADIILTKEASE